MVKRDIVLNGNVEIHSRKEMHMQNISQRMFRHDHKTDARTVEYSRKHEHYRI